MPRNIHPDLLDCLRRDNPYIEYRVEVSKPDVGQILRRPDQFTEAPTLVSTSVGTFGVAGSGALEIAAGSANLASFAGEQSFYSLNIEDPQRRVKGLEFTPAADFARARLRTISCRVQRNTPWFGSQMSGFELQLYRVVRTPGVFQKVSTTNPQQVTATDFVDYAFTPLLSSPAFIRHSNIVWTANKATLNFDLSQYHVELANTATDSPDTNNVGELPRYYIVLRLVGGLSSNQTDYFRWLVDTASTRTIGGVGTFQRVFWARNSDAEQWVPQYFTDVPACTIAVDSYVPQAKGIYLLTMQDTPSAASTGRVDFQPLLPAGTSATAELSTTGAGGTFTAVKHGDIVSVKQGTYHMRITLNSDAAGRASAGVVSFGIEFREPVDVSVESIPSFPTRSVDTPFLAASIPEARLRVIRDGIRDYLDKATVLGSTAAPPKLEVDIYLASAHPAVTRDKWFLLERLMVTNRVPSGTAEDFTLLSYASKLKRKIPARAESINSVHTVSSSTTSSTIVSPALPGAGAEPTSGEYDGKGYYIRVRSSATLATGYLATIQGNTGPTQLDVPLPAALTAGDVIEVHSGQYATVPLTWRDADPADVWLALLTEYRGIPMERIGRGDLPRGGLPPKVTDRAPGDTTTQAKLKVSNTISEPEGTDDLLDQLSFIMGGATVEIAGQICFVQIYPYRDLTGTQTVSPPAVARVFDVRDYAPNPLTPPGIESRGAVISAGYGVNNASSTPSAFPQRYTTVIDVDAVNWLTQQDLEDVGAGEVPDKVARWLYNSADEGLLLASIVAAQVVLATSTGKRVFMFAPTTLQPELVVGDVVVFITDQYTDYDPATQTSIKGVVAILGVLVSVGDVGKQLGLYVLGLTGNVVSLAGGADDLTPGSTAGDRPEALYGLLDFKPIAESANTITYGWTRGELVAEVWAAYLTTDVPISLDKWAEVSSMTAPLPAGQDTIVVPQPTDAKRVLLQVEPRDSNKMPGPVRRAEIKAAPSQPPVIDIDTIEGDTTGTLWWRVQERGKLVVSNMARVQIGEDLPGGYSQPTRIAGEWSFVKARTLAAGESEHDILLDSTRKSWVGIRIALSSGETETRQVSFDRNKRPDIDLVYVDGAKLTVVGDSDTKSIRLTSGSWEYWVNGISIAQLDISAAKGTNGVAAMPSNTSWPIHIVAYAKPREYVDGATLKAEADAVVKGSTAGTLPVFEKVELAAPATNGTHTVTLQVDADSAPAGHTLRVSERHNGGAGWSSLVVITSALSPVPTAPPTAETAYTWAGLPATYDRTVQAGGKLVEVEMLVEILNGSSVVVASMTKNTTWYYGSTGAPAPTDPPPPDPVLPPYQPAPSWDSVDVMAPAVGSRTVNITLDASDAVGAVQVLERHDSGGGWSALTDITSALGVTVPPSGATVYPWSGLNAVFARVTTTPNYPFAIEITARIYQNGTLVAERTASTAWQSGYNGGGLSIAEPL